MPIAQLFANLYRHNSAKTLEFGETDRFFLDNIPKTFVLNFDETGMQLKQILDARYVDGISGLEDVSVGDDIIAGVFTDIVSPNLTKKFKFTINADTGEVAYEQIDTGNLEQEFTELEFAGKSATCKEGKSSPCKRADNSVYCIPLGKKCKSVGLNPQEKAVVQEVAAKAKKSSAKKISVDSKQVDKKSTTEPVKQVTSNPTQFDVIEGYDRKTIKKLNDLLSEYEKLKDKVPKNLIQDSYFVNASIYKAGIDGKGKYLGVTDSKGKIQASVNYAEEKNHIYVDLLATSPWNLNPKDRRKTKGAGVAALEQIAKKALDKGHGNIELVSLDGARGFYEKIGFVTKPGTDPKDGLMVLNKQATQEFLRKRGYDV